MKWCQRNETAYKQSTTQKLKHSPFQKDVQLRLLAIIAKEYWNRKVPRTRFYAVEAIGRLIDVHCSGTGFDDWNDSLPINENLSAIYGVPNKWPAAILVYKPDQYHGWEHALPPVVTTFNDAWEIETRLNDIRLPRCKLVIMHHANEMAEWQQRCPEVRFENISYPVNPEVFYANDTDTEKQIDILLTGAIDSKIYPLRHRFRQLIKTGAFDPFHAAVRNHSGYRLDNPHAESIAYAGALRSAKICLADTSCYGYAAEKYHEIPACGSVLCGNLPDERQSEFSKFMITIDPDWSDNRIVREIRWYLDRPALLQCFAEKGKDYIHNNFTIHDYAKRLVTVLESLL